jgi:hypothetical protein
VSCHWLQTEDLAPHQQALCLWPLCSLQLANKYFKSCGLRLLPIELRGLTQQPGWSFVSPRVNDENGMQVHLPPPSRLPEARWSESALVQWS